MNIKRQVQTFVVLSSILALLPACWPFDKKEETKQDLYVINVLDKVNYEDCHIAGSKNVPFEDVETFAKDLDRNAEVVVYCSNYMCSASAAAAQKLKDMGFANVWAYEGGTAEWYQLGLKEKDNYPVEGSCQSSYLAASNEKPAHAESSVSVISAEELHAKMMAHGMIEMAQAQVQVEEVPQQAAA